MGHWIELESSLAFLVLGIAIFVNQSGTPHPGLSLGFQFRSQPRLDDPLGLRTNEDFSGLAVVFSFVARRPVNPNAAGHVDVAGPQDAGFARTAAGKQLDFDERPDLG